MTTSAQHSPVSTHRPLPPPSAAHRYDVFLSHRFKDQAAVEELFEHIENDLGYEVYVDWKVDPDLDRARVNRETAERFRQAMRHCGCLLFYARPDVELSKWMPWELGFFDGRHGARRIAVYTDDPQGFRAGQQEYLDLYQVIEKSTLPDFLEHATTDTAAMTSATYDQLQRHLDKLRTDPLDYGLSVAQWYFGASANLMLDPARMQAFGDDEPSGPLLPWLEPLGIWYDLLRQQQRELAHLRQDRRRQVRTAKTTVSDARATMRKRPGAPVATSDAGALKVTGSSPAEGRAAVAPSMAAYDSLLRQTLHLMSWPSGQHSRPNFQAAVTAAR
jgi:hypothetical protein